MQTAIVGTMNAKKGIVYSGLVPLGNAFRVDANVRVSVNYGGFVDFPRDTDVHVSTEFDYIFENDVGVLLTRIVQDDLSIEYENSNSLTMALNKDTESSAVVAVTVYGDMATVQIDAACYVSSNKNDTVTIRVYKNASTLLNATPKVWAETGEQNIAIQFDEATVVTGDVFHYTIESDGNDSSILGNVSPNIIRVTKKG